MDRRDNAAEPHLLRLEEMKRHRVAKNESDIRGWDVVTADRRKVGQVHDLVVDVASMTVRYLDVAVDAKILGTKAASHVLLPISGASLDDDDERVYLDDITLSKLTSLPPFDHRRITRDFEASIAGLFTTRATEVGPTATAPAAEPPTETRSMTSEEERFWGARRKGRVTPYLSSVDETGDPPPRS